MHFYAARNVVQIGHLSQFIDHNCGRYKPVNIEQAQHQDIIDLTSEDSDGETSISKQDQECIDIDSDIEVVENL